MAIRLEPILQEFKVENKLALAGIGAVTAALAAVATTAGLAVNATFKWAGELDSIQDVMGVTSNEAAALNFVLRKSGTETDKLTKGMVVLEKGLFKTDGTLDTVGEKMAEFGINALDVNGNMKDQASLISEISNKYNSLGTQAERVNLLTELFGKSGAELIDVFDTLAKEGGIDKVEDKVKKLGLAIDPQKYEDMQRLWEEIKLSFLGVAVTVVDNLMPSIEGISNWWERSGRPAFESMVKWLGTNVPLALKSMGGTMERNVIPPSNELVRLWTNLNTILEKLSPGVGGLAGKFTPLGIVQRIAVAEATIVNNVLHLMTQILQAVNGALESLINNWSRFGGTVNSAVNTAVAAINRLAGTSIPAPTVIPVSSGSTGTRTTSTPVRRGRANQGDLSRGLISNVNERKQEVFMPGQGGSVRSGLDIQVKFSDRELDRIGRTMARALKPVVMRMA